MEKIKILLDPGHGGDDPGAVALWGNKTYREADINLNMALILEAIFKTHTEYEVHMTRRTDDTVALTKRTTMANELEAYLISIHNNAAAVETASGSEVLCFSRFNKDGSVSEGYQLAEAVQSNLVKLGQRDRGVKPIYDRVEEQFIGRKLHVVVKSRKPCILIEGGFITNASDANKIDIDLDGFNEKVATSIFLGIDSILGQKVGRKRPELFTNLGTLSYVEDYKLTDIQRHFDVDELIPKIGSNEIKVAVADTGVSQHVDLISNICKEFGFAGSAGNTDDKQGHGCISKNSFVFTNFCGVEEIETLFERLGGSKEEKQQILDVKDLNIKTISINKDTGEVERDQITHVHKTWVDENIIEIIAEDGTLLELTPWHPIYTMDESGIIQKRADEIRKEDLLLNPNKYVDLEDTYREFFGIKVTEDIGYFIGALLGDGSLIRKDRIDFQNCNETIHQFVQKVSLKLGATSVNDSRTHNSKYKNKSYASYLYGCDFVNLVQNLYEQFGKKDNVIFIPRCISKAPKSVVGAFLAGYLDTDGFVSNNVKKPTIVFTTISESMANTLNALLQKSGIVSRITRLKKVKTNEQVLYQVRITGRESMQICFKMIKMYMLDRQKLNKLDILCANPYQTERKKFYKINYSNFLKKSLNRENVRLYNSLKSVKRNQNIATKSVVSRLLSFCKIGINFENEYTRQLERFSSNFFGKKIKLIKRKNVKEWFYDFTVVKNNNYLAGKNGLAFVSNTHVASIIAGEKNAFGVTGINPTAKIVPVKVLNDDGSGSISDLINAIEWCISNNIKVVNMSLGSQAYHPQLETICQKAYNKGIILIAAAGNNHRAVARTIETDFPAIFDSVLSVGAVDKVRRIADFSSRGKTFITAPGVEILGCVPVNRYAYMSGTCLTGDTAVYTEEGPVEIRDLKVGMKVWSYNEQQKKYELKRVTKHWSRGIKETYKLKASRHSIDATGNHPFLVINPKSEYSKFASLSWKKLEDLEIGDMLACLDDLSSDINERIPEELNSFNNDQLEALMEIIGVYIGDGWLDFKVKRSYKVEFVIYDNYLKEAHRQLFNTAFNDQIRWIDHRKGYRVCSKMLVNLFLSLGLKGNAHTKRIPSWVYCLSKELKQAFVKGYLDSDGTIVKSTGRMNFECCNKALMQDFRFLLSGMGFNVSELSYKRRESFGSIQTKLDYSEAWQISISDPKRIEKEIGTRTANYYEYWKKDRRDGNYNRLDASMNIKYALVNEITSLGEDEVYDIEVEDNHNFIANGLIVHNSQATPFVTGVVSIMLSINPQLTPKQVMDIICDTADDAGVKGYDKVYGHGIINSKKCIEKVIEMTKIAARVEEVVEEPKPKKKRWYSGIVKFFKKNF